MLVQDDVELKGPTLHMKMTDYKQRIPDKAPITLQETQFDTDPPGGQPYEPPLFESLVKMLAAYDEGVETARAMLASATDAELMVPWVLKHQHDRRKNDFTIEQGTTFRRVFRWRQPTVNGEPVDKRNTAWKELDPVDLTGTTPRCDPRHSHC